MGEEGRGVDLPHYSGEEGFDILDGMEGVADVDKVVLFWRVDPFFFEVIDEKVHVFGDEGWLNRGQVDAGYRAIRILVAN